MSFARTFLAGSAGGLALNLTMLLTFRALGFGWGGQGILLTHATQSQKLIAVWTSLEPLPRVIADPLLMTIGLLLFGVGHAFVYRSVSAGWPSGYLSRAARFAGLLFFMVFAFWEFFTPWNLFGEPLSLVALELCFWAVVATAEAFVIAFVIERGGAGTTVNAKCLPASCRGS